MKLSINNLYKSFGDKKAVNDVNFTIKKGEIFTLLGASGSGKTTILRTITGFEVPTSGIIKFDDKVISDKQTFITPEKRSVGLVFQDLALFPHMTVEKNILFAMNKDDDLDEIIDLCKLTGLKNRYPHEISGGEMQRVALARAIASNPEILLLDEPFNNLDIILKESILKDIKRIIKKRGITALFVTHHKDEAYYLSDRIAIMKKGHIEQIGTPMELYKFPVSEYTASFLGKVNLLTKNEIKGLVRPENIEITKNGSHNGIIRDICFHGQFTELKVQQIESIFKENYIYIHTKQFGFNVGESINYSMDWRSFL